MAHSWQRIYDPYDEGKPARLKLEQEWLFVACLIPETCFQVEIIICSSLRRLILSSLQSLYFHLS